MSTRTRNATIKFVRQTPATAARLPGVIFEVVIMPVVKFGALIGVVMLLILAVGKVLPTPTEHTAPTSQTSIAPEISDGSPDEQPLSTLPAAISDQQPEVNVSDPCVEIFDQGRLLEIENWPSADASPEIIEEARSRLTRDLQKLKVANSNRNCEVQNSNGIVLRAEDSVAAIIRVQNAAMVLIPSAAPVFTGADFANLTTRLADVEVLTSQNIPWWTGYIQWIKINAVEREFIEIRQRLQFGLDSGRLTTRADGQYDNPRDYVNLVNRMPGLINRISDSEVLLSVAMIAARKKAIYSGIVLAILLPAVATGISFTRHARRSRWNKRELDKLRGQPFIVLSEALFRSDLSDKSRRSLLAMIRDHLGVTRQELDSLEGISSRLTASSSVRNRAVAVQLDSTIVELSSRIRRSS
jgi:hypothetical protein